MLPLSKYTFYNCHLSPAVNNPAIKWKQCMMMVRLVMIRLVMVRSVMLMVRLVMIRLVKVVGGDFHNCDRMETRKRNGHRYEREQK